MINNEQYNIPWQDIDCMNFGGADILRQAQFQMKANEVYHLKGNQTILYFESGKGVYWVDEKEKKKYKSGHMIMLKAEALLWFTSDQMSDCYIIEVVHINDWFQFMLEEKACLCIQTNDRIARQFDLFWKYVVESMPNNRYSLSKELYQLLMMMDQFSRENASLYTPLVQETLDLIQEEYAFLEGLDEIADIIGCSKSHLIRLFKKEVGQSPGQYLQQTRLTNATILLKSQPLNIEVIANMVGYSCANYFCKVFQKQFGESPGEYRKRNASQVKRIEKERVQKILNVYQV